MSQTMQIPAPTPGSSRRAFPRTRSRFLSPASTDEILRELAYVYRLTERVRAAVTAGEAALPSRA